VTSPEKCTGCRQCELLCPDYCVRVEEIIHE
jgi:NAD-dependent dihydropyrimidine dehydrogenase PreA subunit